MGIGTSSPGVTGIGAGVGPLGSTMGTGVGIGVGVGVGPIALPGGGQLLGGKVMNFTRVASKYKCRAHLRQITSGDCHE